MRVDEEGQPCPGTLYEYRDMCRALGGPNCEAVRLLDRKIAENGGNDDTVIQADSQMRMLLMPLLFKSPPATTDRVKEMVHNGLLQEVIPEEAVAKMAQGIADAVDAELSEKLDAEIKKLTEKKS